MCIRDRYDAATDGMYTQAEYDAAAEDMFTQTDVDDAVAEATEDMYTQAEYDAEVTALATLQAAYDALIGSGANAVYTQEEYENAVWEAIHKGIEITASNLGYAFANDGEGFDDANDEAVIEYMEGICSGEVSASSGACK